MAGNAGTNAQIGAACNQELTMGVVVGQCMEDRRLAPTPLASIAAWALTSAPRST
jgi:hypothetical protein